MKKAICVDLDGTLAIFEGRRKWNDFEAVEKDEIRNSVKLIMDHYNTLAGDVIIVTGRPESCRIQTERWLAKHGVPYTKLYMATDDSHDTDTKRAIYQRHIKPNYHVDFVVEDRNSVVQMYRDLGLDCFQIELTDY